VEVVEQSVVTAQVVGMEAQETLIAKFAVNILKKIICNSLDSLPHPPIRATDFYCSRDVIKPLFQFFFNMA
jgi:hypothetical protein